VVRTSCSVCGRAVAYGREGRVLAIAEETHRCPVRKEAQTSDVVVGCGELRERVTIQYRSA
jgi:hypothetical protein